MFSLLSAFLLYAKRIIFESTISGHTTYGDDNRKFQLIDVDKITRLGAMTR